MRLLQHPVFLCTGVVLHVACAPERLPEQPGPRQPLIDEPGKSSEIRELDESIAKYNASASWSLRAKAYEERGDAASLRKAMADADGCIAAAKREAATPAGDRHNGWSCRLMKARLQCKLAAQTKQAADQEACFSLVEAESALDPSETSQFWSAQQLAIGGADLAKIEPHIAAGKKLLKQPERNATLEYTIWKVYEALAPRVAGTADEAKYREMAAAAKKKHDVILAAANAASSPAPSKPVSAEDRAREEARFAQARKDRERQEGIEKYGMCPYCEGHGEIRWELQAGQQWEDLWPYGWRVEPCGKCNGLGYKGPGYSFLNADRMPAGKDGVHPYSKIKP